MEGKFKSGRRNTDDATGKTDEVVEVGYFRPGNLCHLVDEIKAGNVGYITASIKNVKDTRVGDTITDG